MSGPIPTPTDKQIGTAIEEAGAMLEIVWTDHDGWCVVWNGDNPGLVYSGLKTREAAEAVKRDAADTVTMCGHPFHLYGDPVDYETDGRPA